MPKSTGLTGTTFDVWTALTTLTEEMNYPPTLKEIGARCGGLSNSNVKHHLDKLEAAACIHRIPRQSRAIRLLKKPER